jgi:hypothetical protein
MFMKAMSVFFLVIFLSSCSNTTTEERNGQLEWDFDHKVQFKTTKLENNKYHLEVIRYSKTAFRRMATLMVRESYEICGQYGFKIEVLEGIELVDDRKAMPNRIFGALKANIECVN